MIDHKEDGTSVWADIPSRFEAGTKNISGVLGLGAAIDYINATGIENITEHVSELVLYATSRLLEIPGIKVISEKDPSKNVGIVSFVCEFAHPHDVAEILARDGVAVRAGHHCAIPYHGAMGIESSIRASFHCYNTKEDIDALIDALKKTKEIFA
jgi:cysteine desulfurase/selenocysteine lyase